MSLAKTLNTLMKEQKMSARTLSKKTGLRHRRFQNLLAGAEPSLKAVRALADHFNCTMEFL